MVVIGGVGDEVGGGDLGLFFIGVGVGEFEYFDLFMLVFVIYLVQLYVGGQYFVE